MRTLQKISKHVWFGLSRWPFSYGKEVEIHFRQVNENFRYKLPLKGQTQLNVFQLYRLKTRGLVFHWAKS